MSTLSAKEAWASALGSLQVEVHKQSYDTYLKCSSGLAIEGDTFVVGVPSPFTAAALERGFTPLVVRTLNGLFKRPMQVAYRVLQNAGNGVHAADLPEDAVLNPLPAPLKQRRRDPAALLNPRYTFDNFVVGKSNRFAHGVAMAVAESPGNEAYNPLYLHGGAGLGKTHLLHAIGIAAQGKGLTVMYASAEQYTNEFVNALRLGKVDDFRTKFRNADVLLIDDIQFIAGKDASRESFFHTFNDLHAASKQIVMSSDTRPRSLPLLEERLRSRMEAGVVADVQAPDLETRMAIVAKKAALSRVKISADVIDFLARRFVRNVRELEGALNRLQAMAQLTNRQVDLELAQQALADIPATAGNRLRNMPPKVIIETVAAYFSLSADELTSPSRRATIALPRQVAAYLLRVETDRSLAEIGTFLGDRGHTTVLRAHDKIAAEINASPNLNRQVGEIRAALERRLSSQSA